MEDNLSKNAEMPVGSAVSRLTKLLFRQMREGPGDGSRSREIESLTNALNAFEVSLAFDCTGDEELQKVVEEAETALDVLLCDAETQCCRITEKVASEANRPRRITSSRGD